MDAAGRGLKGSLCSAPARSARRFPRAEPRGRRPALPLVRRHRLAKAAIKPLFRRGEANEFTLAVQRKFAKIFKGFLPTPASPVTKIAADLRQGAERAPPCFSGRARSRASYYPSWRCLGRNEEACRDTT
jgi:hypothetical protein